MLLRRPMAEGYGQRRHAGLLPVISSSSSGGQIGISPLCFLSMSRPLAFFLLLAFPFSVRAADWRAEANTRIEQLRKGDFSFTIQSAAGTPLAGAEVSYQLKRHAFLFGTAISYQAFSDRGSDG